MAGLTLSHLPALDMSVGASQTTYLNEYTRGGKPSA